MNDALKFQISNDDWIATPNKIQTMFITAIEEINRIADEYQSYQVREVELLEESKKQKEVFDSVLPNFTIERSEKLLKEMSDVAKSRPRTERQVVFICDFACSRQVKLGYALKELGWEAILLYKYPPSFDPSKFFFRSHQFNGDFEAVIIACSYSPIVYHCFSTGRFNTAKALIKFAPGKIVFDDYDIFAGSLTPELEELHKEALLLEKECIETADAMVHRSLNGQYSKQHLNYKYPKKQIFYPEYCWDNIDSYRKPFPKKLTDAIHVVYVGTVPDPAKFFIEPGPSATVCDRVLIRQLTDRGVHYHLFPFHGGMSEEQRKIAWKDIYKEAEENKLFHIHEHVDSDKLPEALAPYHFGICSISEAICKNGQDRYYKLRNFQKGTCNKAFDYLDANIVHVSYGWDFLERLIGKNGPLVIASREKTAEILSAFNPLEFESQFKDKLQSARKRLSVWRHASRLEKFYNWVAEES